MTIVKIIKNINLLKNNIINFINNKILKYKIIYFIF